VVQAYSRIINHYENCLVLLFGGDNPHEDNRGVFSGHELGQFFWMLPRMLPGDRGHPQQRGTTGRTLRKPRTRQRAS
jgi:hypothetical protein